VFNGVAPKVDRALQLAQEEAELWMLGRQPVGRVVVFVAFCLGECVRVFVLFGFCSLNPLILMQ
jgi:hypothetical protein